MKMSFLRQAAIAATLLLCAVAGKSQSFFRDTTVADDGLRCGVAHITKDGVFSCDFRGTLYPERIYDTTVSKWFIKVWKDDSIFYYKTDTVYKYVWNGRPHNEMYGYQQRADGMGITLPDRWNGSDTMYVKEQLWRPIGRSR